VAGLAGVNEERRRAGRGERRRDLAADMTALAHAHDDDPAAAREQGLHRGDEGLALARLESLDGTRLDVERGARELQRAHRVEGGQG